MPGWMYRITPYGWLTALDGTTTVRGRSVKVDASFIDIVEKSDTLVALSSDFSWQAIGAYGFELGIYQGITFSGAIGYRALYVDYAQGEGRQRYEFDMLQHGPTPRF